MQADSSRLEVAKIKDLRPTQITVGKLAVKTKAAKWKALSPKKRQEHLDSHWFPAVKGPEDAYFITDHHHTGLALLECGVKKAQLIVLKDFSGLKPKAFWMAMDHCNWIHPYNAKGERGDVSEIPSRLRDLVDDPYRSLADQVQKLGGYAETAMPYAEFLWADYFRGNLDMKLTASGWETAVAAALSLAKEQQAACLPGWCGAAAESGQKG